MGLNLYLDDCSNSQLLADLLAAAGHKVVRPTRVAANPASEDGATYFAYAVANGLTIVTKNPADSLLLHQKL